MKRWNYGQCNFKVYFFPLLWCFLFNNNQYLSPRHKRSNIWKHWSSRSIEIVTSEGPCSSMYPHFNCLQIELSLMVPKPGLTKLQYIYYMYTPPSRGTPTALQDSMSNTGGSLCSVNFSRDNRQSKLLKIKGGLARMTGRDMSIWEIGVCFFTEFCTI